MGDHRSHEGLVAGLVGFPKVKTPVLFSDQRTSLSFGGRGCGGGGLLPPVPRSALNPAYPLGVAQVRASLLPSGGGAQDPSPARKEPTLAVQGGGRAPKNRCLWPQDTG